MGHIQRRKVMYKLLKKMKPIEWLMIVLSFIFIISQVWIDLKLPDYMSEITQKLVTQGTQLSDLYQPGSMMVVLSLLSLLTSMCTGFFAARVAASFSQHLRQDIFHRVMSFSTNEMNHFSIPSLITRTTNDVVQIQNTIAMGLQVIIKGPIMAAWAIYKIADKNIEWLLATVVAVVVMLILVTIIIVFAVPKQRIIQTLTDKLNGVSRENLVGVRVIRAYNAEAFQDRKFSQANHELMSANLFSMRIFALMSPVLTLVSSTLSLSVYWIGAHLIQAADLTQKAQLFGDMTVFMSYAMQVVFGFMMMTMIFMILPRALVSAKRINEVLETTTSIVFPEQTESPSTQSDALIEYRNVGFSYSDSAEPVISNVSFKAYSGQTIAFIGSTGSGKSTLVNLLPRFYDVTQGEILLDGKPLTAYDQETLNNIVGYLPQKPVIFSGTIASNMDFGRSPQTPLSKEQMLESLDLAQASELVKSKEAGLDSHVAQNGSNFSGGQKQRLAIARSLARKPRILIFDDSFSALDYKTDKTLRHMLSEKTQNMTKLIVAQRISTIMDADLILVLDNGEVVGQGTHSELLKNNEVYQEIAYSQLSKEELQDDHETK